MKSQLLLLALVAYFLNVFTLNAKHSLWVWDMSDDIIFNEQDRMDFWSFIEAPHAKPELKVSTIYLSIGKNMLKKNPKKVSEFLADAHSRDISVEYLTGDPRWALSIVNPRNGKLYNQPSFDELKALLAYNTTVLENERFDGYHQDTEPYTLGIRPDDPLNWKEDKAEIWEQFVATTKTWKSMIDEHNSATGDDLIMGSAISFWLDTDESDITSNEDIQDIVDYVSIMNYNTKLSEKGSSEKQGFIETVAGEVAYGKTPNSVYAGMETLELNYKEPNKGFFQQFYTSTASYFYGSDAGKGVFGIEGLAKDSAAMEKFFENSPAYGGNAFHFYEDKDNGDSSFRALGYDEHENAPVVWLISPSHTQVLSGAETIDYVAYDPDGDALKLKIEYSKDDGLNWNFLTKFKVSDKTDEVSYRTVSWDFSTLDVGSDYLLRITATENTKKRLSSYDQSDYSFSIAKSKKDKKAPKVIDKRSIKHSYKKSKEIELWWKESTDNDAIIGYYVFYAKGDALKRVFSRGNRIRIEVPKVDSTYYLWAVDRSGNLSEQTSYEISAIEDMDKDGLVDGISREVDRDGDGVNNYDEAKEGSDPDDPTDFSDSRVLGHWMFEGDLKNLISDEPSLFIDDKNGEVTGGSLAYSSDSFTSGKSIKVGGNSPIWLPLETNPASHKNVYALTIEMWIKPDPTAKDDLSFIPLACFGDMESGLTLLLKNNSDLLALRRYTGAGKGTYSSINAQNDQLFDGKWHHVAASYNGYSGMLKLYVDGELVNQSKKKYSPIILENTRVLRFLDGRSNYDNQNSSNNNVEVVNSAQFENSFYDFTDPNADDDIDVYPIRYIGLIDDIKVTQAAVPAEKLSYHQYKSKD